MNINITICIYLLFSNQVMADVYSYVDESDVMHFSDAPNDPRYSFEMASDYAKSQLAAPSNTIETTSSINDHVARVAVENQLDRELLHAVIKVESNYRTDAYSSKGAQGLMQLMPATAMRFGVVDRLNPSQNIQGGAKYLRALLSLFNNDLSLALAAYNAGENAVIKYGYRIPPYKETQAYVPKVLNVYRALLAQSKAGY